MGEPIKIRAKISGDITDIRIMLQHPMETGQRKDEKGSLLPMHFIKAFSISHNGKPLIDGQLNTSIAKNPLFAFKARGIKTGDRLTVTWQDNIGDTQRNEILLT